MQTQEMKKEGLFLLTALIVVIVLGSVIINETFFASESGNTAKIIEVSPTPALNAIQGDDSNTQIMGDQTPKPTVASGLAAPTGITINVSKKYTATLKTSVGDMVVELSAQKTPVTVNNFVYLSQNNFYNNTIFHRVINGFMIQGGDPKGDGTGGPGYRFNDEPIDGEYKRGTVAMANAGPNTNGSQFFIIHNDTPLPKNYVIFGQLVSGEEVLDKIATAPVATSSSGENSKPVSPVVVSEVLISEQ